MSLQPNAGSQGEYAGLLAIRAWHHSRGDGQRDVCLIPASAHGTNAACAVMAGHAGHRGGLRRRRQHRPDDLTAKVDHSRDDRRADGHLPVDPWGLRGGHRRHLPAVHDAGGQVYTDGANLNALVGVAQPGRFGSDVSHLNLHKTFCIPHGGGGPGVGPVAVAPPGPLPPRSRGPPPDLRPAVGAVSAAPSGSAGILPISWVYIAVMGPDGLRRATEVAVLAANYMADRLEAYPVLYTGTDGLVAHECILDLRPIKKATGITDDDVAKRLVDYGFHAPTMSFPVPGTLMIEPTESESLRARPVLRRHDRHQGRDRRRRCGYVARG